MPARFHYGPLLSVAVLAGIGVAMWHYWPRQPEPVATAPVATAAPTAEPAPVDVAPMPPQYPIEQVEIPPAIEAGPLPVLDDSDTAFLDALSAVDAGIGEWLVREFIVPRLVATIDNLPNRRVTQQIYAGRPAPGSLVVAEADGRLWLDSRNSARYDAGLVLLERVDLRRAVAVYVHWYPLFQRAYRDLGGPDRQFNDRLVEVIDHLIAAPEATGPLELQRQANGGPRLEFADPRREAASVGHKAMWRLGPDHAERMRARLQELRALLAGQRPGA